MVLVTVETVSGEIGYAPVDASSSVMREFSNDGSLDKFVDVIERAIAPSLKREVITSIKTVGKIIRQTRLSQQFKSRSIAALDIALHDIKGKQNGVPVYELLSEKDEITSEVPLYASGGMYLPRSRWPQKRKASWRQDLKATNITPVEVRSRTER
ncbi:hypothetical protein ACFFQF_27740 [Haladaptatus pallidirubidus]|uniref:hypothetical protein n=1 Tax=Haladaptatus pallidirubidus TaxID=1008152 RepID=UPI0035EDBAF7